MIDSRHPSDPHPPYHPLGRRTGLCRHLQGIKDCSPFGSLETRSGSVSPGRPTSRCFQSSRRADRVSGQPEDAPSSPSSAVANDRPKDTLSPAWRLQCSELKASVRPDQKPKRCLLSTCITVLIDECVFVAPEGATVPGAGAPPCGRSPISPRFGPGRATVRFSTHRFTSRPSGAAGLGMISKAKSPPKSAMHQG